MHRKEFLQTGAAAMAITIAGVPVFNKNIPKLSFSTLGCPDWAFDTIIDFAVRHSYTGLELRGILREMDLTKCPEFATAERRLRTMQQLRVNGLSITDLGSSATLHYDDATVRAKNIDEGKRFIDLAEQIGCPFIRVFPNKFLEGKEHAYTIDLIVKGLRELAAHAKGTKVAVLMETHGDLVDAGNVKQIMEASADTHTGLVWDIVNMWSITKVPPATVYPLLKPYIRHTHIKDALVDGSKINYTLLGQGNTPIFDAIDLLEKNNYTGFYSFEWEKLWHPEIAAPEIAIAAYARTMREHLKVK
jgi:sugar phosphate isomerase/epimerase